MKEGKGSFGRLPPPFSEILPPPPPLPPPYLLSPPLPPPCRPFSEIPHPPPYLLSPPPPLPPPYLLSPPPSTPCPPFSETTPPPLLPPPYLLSPTPCPPFSETTPPPPLPPPYLLSPTPSPPCPPFSVIPGTFSPSSSSSTSIPCAGDSSTDFSRGGAPNSNNPSSSNSSGHPRGKKLTVTFSEEISFALPPHRAFPGSRVEPTAENTNNLYAAFQASSERKLQDRIIYNCVRGFDVMDTIKSQVESLCPGVVSCADIVAVAARDSVVALGGPTWTVQLGRRDSTTASFSTANSDLPPPTSNLSDLITLFHNKGFTT